MADKTYKELSKRLSKKNKDGAVFKDRSAPEKANDAEPKPSASKKQKNSRQKTKTKDSRSSSKSVKNKLPSFINTNTLLIIGCGLLVVFAIYMLAIRKNATEILLNDDVFGQVKTLNLTEDVLLESVKARLEENLGTEVRIEDVITVFPKHGKKKLLMDHSELVNKLVNSVSYKVNASEIAVNGEVIGIVKNEEEANSIFRNVMKKYEPETENEVVSRFIEDVTSTKTFVREDFIIPSDEVQAILEKTNTIREVYVVQEGDNLYSIAGAHGMTLEDISKNNDDLDINKPIKVGMQINVVSTKPFVSVETIETKKEEKKIDRQVTTETDSRIAPGSYSIKAQGKDGKKEVITEITRLNGIVIKSEVVDEIITEQPENQIRVVNG